MDKEASMRFAPFFLFLPAMLSAQQTGAGTGAGVAPGQTAVTAPQSAETKPEDKCSLEGKVVSNATGEPVKKASILLRRTDLSPATGGFLTTYTTSSDTGGKFA